MLRYFTLYTLGLIVNPRTAYQAVQLWWNREPGGYSQGRMQLVVRKAQNSYHVYRDRSLRLHLGCRLRFYDLRAGME